MDGIDSGREIDIMGIVNLTDNSYYSPSRCLNSDGTDDIVKIIERVALMISQGATYIDLGACSSKPGSVPVGAEEEWRRLEPALKAVKEAFPDTKISIDTYLEKVVRKTFDLIGPFLVNDISAGEDDPKMLPTVGKLGLEYVAMHKRGTPSTMQAFTDYANVTDSVVDYFKEFSDKADENGIKNWILDPGFGFAKTANQNLQLLGDLGTFQAFHKRVLVGISRKSMIYKPFRITPEDSLPATQVLHYIALQHGADILRVHDVREAAQTIDYYRQFN
ncbi:MAG: dihydropteroate synthase [Bacteroidales bacterium]